MGLIDFINKFKKTKPNINYAKMLNGYTPIFSQFGQDIYASDVVQQAIACLVTELTKANPFHIKQSGSDLVPVENSEIQKLLDQPNERMTQTDFFEKVYWQLFLNYNSFIIPTYYKDIKGNKHYTGLYPIQPTNVTFLQDPEGKLGIEFTFRNGYKTMLAYSDVIHIRYRYSINEFMGGNEFGQPDNRALLKTLELNNTLLQGVAKALKSSFSINGVIKYNTLMDDGKMENNIKEIEKRLANNESGFLPLDIKGEYIPLQNKIQLVDATTLKFIDEKILRNIGVSLPILTGDYTKPQYEAFYQKSLEPILKRTGESFTMTMFTNREKGFKNKVMMYPHELIFMDTSQKIELFDVLVDSASCYKNELRTAFGMRPLPELAGQIAMSSNKANAENNKIKKDGGNKNEE
jgi:phage portal protein|nr:MAG TPA: portal protein [Caudoviricetes sp.]